MIHSKELKRTTNTGRLACFALENSKVIVRGEKNVVTDLTPLLAEPYESLLLYPSKDAIDISEIKLGEKPVQIFVPDGNWRQASKVPNRHIELKNIQAVKVSSDQMRSHFLRREHFDEGLSTIEAIALALKAIEGESVYDSLISVYEAKLAATLKGRGIFFAFNTPYGTQSGQ